MKKWRYTGEDKLNLDGVQVFPGEIIERDNLEGLETNKFVETDVVVVEPVRVEIVEVSKHAESVAKNKKRGR